MADWESLRHFAALHTEGTLAGAARSLGVDHVTVGRRVAALERELNTKLVDRRGRLLLLTNAGQALGSSLKSMKTAADAVERIAAGHREVIAGEVRISAPPGFAAALLAPSLLGIRASHPELCLSVIAENRQTDLEKREADLAVRLARPVKGDLTATKLGELNFRLYASRRYLKGHAPESWTFIGYDAPMSAAPHQAAMRRFAGTRPVALQASTVELQLSLATEGGGIAMLPDLIAIPKGLVPAADEVVVQREAWMIIHSDMVHSAPVRAVADAIRDGLRAALRKQKLAG